MEMQRSRGPQTLRGHWRATKKACLKDGIAVPTLRATARALAKHVGTKLEGDPSVRDAVRWLTVKSGGTAEERKARALRQRERRASNRAAKDSKKGKGVLKPSGEGKKKGKGK